MEDNLVYALYKSSDLKNLVETEPRRYTLITQKKVGQDTGYIKREYPKTYKYLLKYGSDLNARKSSIYNNKPPFSIFGIGDYSFKPFKVAISGLYKSTVFSLLLPNDGKPVMLDDTCYFLGFESLEYAQITHFLLNKKETQNFLASIIFFDSKRAISKEILMRIDLLKIAQHTLPEEFGFEIPEEKWNEYIDALKPIEINQAELSFI